MRDVRGLRVLQPAPRHDPASPVPRLQDARGAHVTTHAIRVTARGPWDRPPAPSVAVYCLCGEWRLLWNEEELQESAAASGTTVAATSWASVAEAVRAQHLEHVALIVQRNTRHRAVEPGPDFY